MTARRTAAEWRIVGLLGLVALLLTAGPVLASSASARAEPNEPQDVTFHWDVQHGYSAGEPEIAVNPTNPANIVMSSTQLRNDCALVFCGGTAINGSTDCTVSTSSNGGRTWVTKPMPLDIGPASNGLPYTYGGDGTVAFGPDGRIYAGCLRLVQPDPTTGKQSCEISVISSENGGRSWSKPIEAIGADQVPEMNARGYNATDAAYFPCDRPWLRVDQSTGTLYATGNQPDRTFVATSNDGGKSFSLPVPMDTPAYQGGGAEPQAANGVLAASYQSGSAAVLETSTDDGAHWVQHVAPASGELAADPVHPGHYAVQTVSNTAVNVYTTSDSGVTWTGPVAINGPPASRFFQPWIAFSSTGLLGAVWRSGYADHSFDVWSAISADGGTQFGQPLKLTETPSPRTSPLFGDDFSNVTFGYGPTSGCVYVGWGDGHDQGSTGLWDNWLASVPLSAYSEVSAHGAVLQGSCAAHP